MAETIIPAPATPAALGQQLGSASFPVVIAMDAPTLVDLVQRRETELREVFLAEGTNASFLRRHTERITLLDSRGSYGRGPAR